MPFSLYRQTAHRNLTHRRRNALHALPLAHRKLLFHESIDYLQSLDQLDAAIENNALLSESIYKFSVIAFGVTSEALEDPKFLDLASAEDVDKVRSTLKQFYRDWSKEGEEERRVCYGPILQELDRRFGDGERGKINVLVPGAGLGRLAFDIVVAGYASQGNEFSFHQLMASNYILNCTSHENQHTIHPFINGFSNHRTRASHLRSVQIPDVHAATLLSIPNEGYGPAGERFSMVAGDFIECYNTADAAGSFNVVATCFFIDTAVNIISYLETIWNVLSPGGVWINYGPLLWHYEEHPPPPGEQAGVELTLEELLKLVEMCGFKVVERRRGEKAGYIENTESMLRHEYEGEFWVAEKVEKNQ